jgi:hypothetical protein
MFNPTKPYISMCLTQQLIGLMVNNLKRSAMDTPSMKSPPKTNLMLRFMIDAEVSRAPHNDQHRHS